MSRGPVPDKGFEVAIPLAERRGWVMFFQRISQDFCDFMIAGAGFVAFVRLRLADRLHGPVAEISADFSGTIAGLGSFPASVQIFRELWLYSRRGALRFFRLGAAGLVEIDSYGIPFVNGMPVIAVPAPAGGTGILPAPPVSPGSPGAEAGNSPATGPAAAGPALPGGLDPKSPIARWLAKRNAAKKIPGKTVAAAGTVTTGSPEHTSEGNAMTAEDGSKGSAPGASASQETASTTRAEASKISPPGERDPHPGTGGKKGGG